jgi:hypothetical protein
MHTFYLARNTPPLRGRDGDLVAVVSSVSSLDVAPPRSHEPSCTTRMSSSSRSRSRALPPPRCGDADDPAPAVGDAWSCTRGAQRQPSQPQPWAVPTITSRARTNVSGSTSTITNGRRDTRERARHNTKAGATQHESGPAFRLQARVARCNSTSTNSNDKTTTQRWARGVKFHGSVTKDRDTRIIPSGRRHKRPAQ